MAITRASLAAIAATACILAAFVGSSDAAMAKITCHCDVGDIEGLCLSASSLPNTRSKVMDRPNPAAQCNVLCATREEVLQRCANAAALHVGEVTCHSFSFDECALSCSDCPTGCELQRPEQSCRGLRIAA
ncbi:hypothetical protein COCSUDRAFT_33304 [Coccomyxa subellipsoidea C-169]|uniref:ShKT domain-containing protein n=1 Tax=Coccomyxa subellipsoidea (strain C-169) TaxID=574566 RepID=I0YY50_COCSC|nr:hypothetical protein COCSUDRAFT_33304 [Coccomyxa subellipsoidea C-169]EIE23319.1 hypothetical protein COCSUDRAFT_33304 [Coccomyxa subellipsoidea C-169]|eukprot:XP_005647863.1 hypothetical protein COCSUDRAFT_33304 [Coccomyxa subellipsoidea C-169]